MVIVSFYFYAYNKSDMDNENAQKLYSFSIIIAAHNEEKYLGQCLESLLKQNYQGSFEIIVVDNASTDNTKAIASGYSVRTLFEPKQGVAYASNLGAKAAQGEILVFTDADAILPADWLAKINNNFNVHPQAVAVGGGYIFYDANKLINFFVEHIAIPFYNKFLFSREPALPSVNLAVNKKIFQKVNGFNPKVLWGEDIKICQRLAKNGSLMFDRELLVFTSFRRYRGGRLNPLLSSAHILKESLVQLIRYYRARRSAIKLSAQKPIR